MFKLLGEVEGNFDVSTAKINFVLTQDMKLYFTGNTLQSLVILYNAWVLPLVRSCHIDDDQSRFLF